MGEPSSGTPPSVSPPEDRLDSWKEIAGYLNRDVTTVQRWEKREKMPVHRHVHDRMGSVYASRAELDAWVRSRNLQTTPENGTYSFIQSPGTASTRGVSDLSNEMEVHPAACNSGSCISDWREPVVTADGILLAKSHL